MKGVLDVIIGTKILIKHSFAIENCTASMRKLPKALL